MARWIESADVRLERKKEEEEEEVAWLTVNEPPDVAVCCGNGSL